MTKMRPVPYAEFRSFLEGIGYVAMRHPTHCVLEHPTKGLLMFRYYRDDEPVYPRDLISTRRFLDLSGLMEADDFDASLLRRGTPA
jgi:hypothetical protein